MMHIERKGDPFRVQTDARRRGQRWYPRCELRARRFASFLLSVACVFQTALATEKRYLDVPDVDWQALVPYVRSNVVPYLRDDDFHVYVCSQHVDTSRISSYDVVLGDFTKTLLLETLRTDRRVGRAIRRATEAFREQIPDLSIQQRKRFSDLYWRSLESDTDFLQRLELRFVAASRDGGLRCEPCEIDPGYRPHGLRDVTTDEAAP